MSSATQTKFTIDAGQLFSNLQHRLWQTSLYSRHAYPSPARTSVRHFPVLFFWFCIFSASIDPPPKTGRRRRRPTGCRMTSTLISAWRSNWIKRHASMRSLLPRLRGLIHRTLLPLRDYRWLNCHGIQELSYIPCDGRRHTGTAAPLLNKRQSD